MVEWEMLICRGLLYLKLNGGNSFVRIKMKPFRLSYLLHSTLANHKKIMKCIEIYWRSEKCIWINTEWMSTNKIIANFTIKTKTCTIWD